MKVRILGISKVDYVSQRTGEPVKGVSLHSAFKDQNVEGEAVDNIFVSDRLGIVGISSIKPGDTVDVEYGRRGSVTNVTLCK